MKNLVLKILLAEGRIDLEKLSKELGISVLCLVNKIIGKEDFNKQEMVIICIYVNELGYKLGLDALFL